MNILNRYWILVADQEKAGELLDQFYKEMTPEQYEGALQALKIGFGCMIERTKGNKHIVKFDRDYAKQLRKEYEAKKHQ